MKQNQTFETLILEQRERYLIVTLNRGKSNPMNMTLVNELREVIAQVKASKEIDAAILAGRTPFYSAGLDVIELYGYDEAKMLQFWKDLAALIAEFSACPKPWVAAITGHSPAGGCVLALCCDFRIMAAGKFKIGLNEIPVGIVIPAPIFHLYAHVLGERQAYQFLLEGRLVLPEEALRVGLIDSVVEPEQVLAAAEAKVQGLLKLTAQALHLSKVNMRAPLQALLTPDFDSAFGPTLKQWWQPESRAALKAVVDSLKK